MWLDAFLIAIALMFCGLWLTERDRRTDAERHCCIAQRMAFEAASKLHATEDQLHAAILRGKRETVRRMDVERAYYLGDSPVEILYGTFSEN